MKFLWDAVPSTWVAAAVPLLAVLAGVVTWRYFMSPLRDIPGHPVASVSRLWHVYHILKGD